MFKLTYEELRNPEFEQSLMRLCSAVFEDEKVTYNLAKIVRRFRSESKAAQVRWNDLIEEYVQKDEHGQVVPAPGQPNSFMVKPELLKEWPAARDAFHATIVELDCHRVSPETVKEAKLNPKHIADLYPILKSLENLD